MLALHRILSIITFYDIIFIELTHHKAPTINTDYGKLCKRKSGIQSFPSNMDYWEQCFKYVNPT